MKIGGPGPGAPPKSAPVGVGGGYFGPLGYQKQETLLLKQYVHYLSIFVNYHLTPTMCPRLSQHNYFYMYVGHIDDTTTERAH